MVSTLAAFIFGHIMGMFSVFIIVQIIEDIKNFKEAAAKLHRKKSTTRWDG